MTAEQCISTGWLDAIGMGWFANRNLRLAVKWAGIAKATRNCRKRAKFQRRAHHYREKAWTN